MKKIPFSVIASFLVMMIFFVSVAYFVNIRIRKNADYVLQTKISNEADNITSVSTQMLSEYSSLLYSIRALFSASNSVERSEWYAYVNSLELKKNYKAITALDYIKRIKRNDVEQYEQSVKQDHSLLKDGYSSFKVHPATNEDELFIVHYIEPIEGNENAFGFDLYSNKERKEALELARDTNSLVISKPIVLVQEDDKTLNSFLMLLPIYQEGKDVTSLQNRRKYLEGYALLAIRVNDFISEALSANVLNNVSDFSIVDVGEDELVLLSSLNNVEGFLGSIDDDLSLAKISRISFGARSWLYKFYAPSLDSEAMGIMLYFPVIIVFLGFIIATLISLTLYNSRLMQSKAEDLAKELTRDLRKFKLAIEYASDQIMITDERGVVIYANPATVNTTGYSPKEVIGKTANFFKLSDSLKTKASEAWKTVAVKKKTFVGKIKDSKKDGEEYTAMVSISPVLDSENKVKFFVIVARDITQEQKIDEIKTQFISVASHQLRTPLSAMRWYLEILLSNDGGKLDKEQKDLVKNIYESNKRMINLVNELLNVSRVESGKIVLKLQEVNIKSFIKSVVKDLKTLIAKHEVEIEISVSKQVKNVWLDSGLFHEVYKNLITNAIKYSADSKKVEVEVIKKDNFIVSRITDFGLGIPDKDKEGIFKKFYRGSNVVGTQVNGSGLGLYLVKLIVEASGGKVWFDSAKNKGTTFWFSVPVKK